MFIVLMSVVDFLVGLLMNFLWVVKSILNIWKSDNKLLIVIEVFIM